MSPRLLRLLRACHPVRPLSSPLVLRDALDLMGAYIGQPMLLHSVTFTRGPR